MPHDTAGFVPHDHSQCVDDALRSAERTSAKLGVKLTPVRRRVLEILLEEHQALGAYDVLARLDAEGLGSKPPIAYRALNFLVENGFAHRIEKLNAFIACASPGKDHTPAFLICRVCDSVAEAVEVSAGLKRSAEANGFQVEETVVEAQGVCPKCLPTA